MLSIVPVWLDVVLEPEAIILIVFASVFASTVVIELEPPSLISV